MSNEVLLAIVACIQSLGTGFLSWQIKRNSCAGEKCRRAIKQVLQIREADRDM